MILNMLAIVIWLFIGCVYSFKDNKIPWLILWAAIVVIVAGQINLLLGGRG